MTTEVLNQEEIATTEATSEMQTAEPTKTNMAVGYYRDTRNGSVVALLLKAKDIVTLRQVNNTTQSMKPIVFHRWFKPATQEEAEAFERGETIAPATPEMGTARTEPAKPKKESKKASSEAAKAAKAEKAEAKAREAKEAEEKMAEKDAEKAKKKTEREAAKAIGYVPTPLHLRLEEAARSIGVEVFVPEKSKNFRALKYNGKMIGAFSVSGKSVTLWLRPQVAEQLQLRGVLGTPNTNCNHSFGVRYNFPGDHSISLGVLTQIIAAGVTHNEGKVAKRAEEVAARDAEKEAKKAAKKAEKEAIEAEKKAVKEKKVEQEAEAEAEDFDFDEEGEDEDEEDPEA